MILPYTAINMNEHAVNVCTAVRLCGCMSLILKMGGHNIQEKDYRMRSYSITWSIWIPGRIQNNTQGDMSVRRTVLFFLLQYTIMSCG